METHSSQPTNYFTTQNDYYEGSDPNKVSNHFGHKSNPATFLAKFKSCGQDQRTEYFLTDNDYYFEGDDDDDVAERE